MRRRRSIFAWAWFLLGATILATLTGVTLLKHNSSPCVRQSLAVKLDPISTEGYEVIGYRCGPKHNDEVQLLIPGVTYSHEYWTGLGQQKYSYVEAAGRRGHTTFAIDRIGIGESSKPPAERVTFPAHGYVTEQLIAALRDGRLGRFKRVIGVGHSVGAGILNYVAGTPGARNTKPDALVLSAFAHEANVPYIAVVNAARYPVQDDPKFRTWDLPPGYLTTPPGTRWIFHNPARVSPGMVAEDEKRKQTVTTGEATTLGLLRDAALSRAVTVPVLLSVGSEDRLYCVNGSCRDEKTFREREAGYFTAALRFDVYVLQGAGHDQNLDPDAGKWFSVSQQWIERLR